ncbi:hypothetical protein BGZ75_001334, partial [Mortierella antarctica]
MVNQLALFGLVDGEDPSQGFPLSISSTATVGDLKEIIKAKMTPRFDDVAAKELTLWRVSIPLLDDAGDELLICLETLTDKKMLRPATDLADVFQKTPPKKTIHILVQRPPP